MGKTTLLRVKRRRDDAPPPLTFQVDIDANSNKDTSNEITSRNSNSTSKRARRSIHQESSSSRHSSHVTHLSHLMHDTSLLEGTSKNQGYDFQSKNEDLHDQKQQQQLRKKSHAVIFRKVTNIPNEKHGYKRKCQERGDATHTGTNGNKSIGEEEEDVKFNVIDATFALETQGSSSSNDRNRNARQIHHEQNHVLQQPPTKRKKLALQMVDSRTMTQREFWNDLQNATSKVTSPAIKTSATASTADTTTGGVSPIPTKTASSSSSSSTTNTKNLAMKKKTKKKNGNVILDPITHKINQSLLSLHPSNDTNISNSNNSDPTESIMAHLETIQTYGSSQLRKYINWKCILPQTSSLPSKTAKTKSKSKPMASDGSTILHMTALLNSTSGAEYICTNYSGIIDFDIVDDDGYTARDVAELVGSDNVAKIISNYIMVHHHDSTSSKNQKWGDRMTDTGGGNVGANKEGASVSIRDYREEEREEDYVYDVYCLDDTTGNNSDDKEVESRVDDDGSKKQSLSGNESTLSSKSWADEHGQREGVIVDNTGCDFSTTSDNDPVLVQMRGGVGYWNEKGELVLETLPHQHDFDSDIDEEEYDSNCEDHNANDYPDEEDEEEYDISYMDQNYSLPQSMMGFVRGMEDNEYDSDDDGIYAGSSDYRNHPIDLGSYSTGYAMHQYGDDEDEIGDGDYTGLMCKDESQWNHEQMYGRTEAYDSDDDED